MNSTLLDLGFFKIKWYSFFIFIGIIIASILIVKEYKKKDTNKERLLDILFYGIIIGILGARLYYVLFNLEYYLSNPIEIVQVWNGGLAIHGGIISVLIFLFVYCKKKKMNFLLLLDILVVGVIIAQSIGRWGNFFNQEAYGRIVSLSFLKGLHLPKFIIEKMFIDGYYREPTFLYESVFSILGFIVLILVRRIKKLRVGQLTGIYFLWYGIERCIIETFRSDSLLLGQFKIAQIISIILCIVGIYLLFKNIKSNKLYKEEKIFIEK
jgi:phosphatidylglycerol:prolipoprotein diacylglycerol transferase